MMKTWEWVAAWIVALMGMGSFWHSVRRDRKRETDIAIELRLKPIEERIRVIEELVMHLIPGHE